MQPHPQGVGGWEGPTGSWQQPVPGNSGLNKDGWSLPQNQKGAREVAIPTAPENPPLEFISDRPLDTKPPANTALSLQK